MKLGIITDVHESLEYLAKAIEALKAAGTDRIIFIGDACRMCEDLETTVAMLAAAGVEGVWGNHDFGLCQKELSQESRERHSAALIQFMQQLQPRLVVEDCHFTHIEPWLDTESLEDLWWCDGLPETQERLMQSFTAVAQRVLFIGHYHRWFLGTPAGLTHWRGEHAIELTAGIRHLVCINALCEGWCAIYDTENAVLTPIDLRVSTSSTRDCSSDIALQSQGT